MNNMADQKTQCSNHSDLVDCDDKTNESVNQETDSIRYGNNVKMFEIEWKNIRLLGTDKDLVKLRAYAVNGGFQKFRSIAWSLLLGDLAPDDSICSWLEQKKKKRLEYNEIKKKHMLDLHNLIDVNDDNPLSQSNSSAWNQHFRDSDLKNLIHQDVMRTNPSVEFYKEESIQEIMLNILFCYAREHPTICYRQGMHEVLAPLIFVIYADQVCVDHIRDESHINIDSNLSEVLNSEYLEADSYSLFCCVMKSLELFYRINDTNISQSGQLVYNHRETGASCSSVVKHEKSEIEVVHQLNIVRDEIFAKNDIILHNHLLKLEIPLAIFGIRWLRLLFGREFNLHDLLILWDSIFGVGQNLQLTYYILVAMLIQIRDKLLSKDYADTLTQLMRYPRVDISIVIRHALFMKNPSEYDCPEILLNNCYSARNSGIQDVTFKKYSTRKYFPPSAVAATSFSSALINSTFDKPAKYLKRQTTDKEIVDGYFINDPEVLKMELQDSHNVIDITKIKLLQYLTVLRRHFPGSQIDEIHQTLDGIQELCNWLQMQKHGIIFDKVEIPVDPAFEPDDSDTLVSKQNSKEIRSFPISVDESKGNVSANYEVPNNRVNRNVSGILKKNAKEIEMNLIRSSQIGWSDDNRYPTTSISYTEKDNIASDE